MLGVTTLFAATIDGVHALRRGDADAEWLAEPCGLQGRHVSSLLVESGLLLAGCHGTDGGLHVSRDGGESWDRHVEGMDSSHVYMLASENRDGRAIFYAGTEPARLYRSSDQANTWEELDTLSQVPGTEKWTFPSPPHIAHVKTMTFAPGYEGQFYVLVEQGALLKTCDDGKTWHEVQSYSSEDDSFYKDVHRLVIHPSDPLIMYLATGNGFYATTNGGESWDKRFGRDATVGYPEMLFLDPADPDTIYIGGAADAPVTWSERGGARPGFIVSNDRGISWQRRMAGLPDPIFGNIEAISMHVGPSGAEFYIGTAVGDVFESRDAGQHWQRIASGLPPISKGRRYRHFLSVEQKAQLEEEAKAERRAQGLEDRHYESTGVVSNQAS